jgi:hypothetical protein
MVSTNPVFVKSNGPNPIMDIVRWLRTRDLVQGTDFDFKYSPKDWHQETFERVHAGATFYFKDEKWATFFRIKYGEDVQQG